MSYIGRGLDKISNIEKLDAITFDGSQSYSLTKSSVAFTPNSANSLIISINGVCQFGNVTVSGTSVDFGVAMPSTDTNDFILHLGVGVVNTPADATVTNAKLAQDIISGETELAVAPADTDEFLVSDAGTLKRIDYSLIKGGITVADQWRITAAHSGSGDITTNWERMDTDNQGLIGSAMTESSGVFTFPSTGTYLVTFVTSCDVSGGDVTYLFSEIWITPDNSNYSSTAAVAGSAADGYRTGNNVTVLLNVSDTSNVKCKFKVDGSAEDFNANGNTAYNRTTAQFIRLGDST